MFYRVYIDYELAYYLDKPNLNAKNRKGIPSLKEANEFLNLCLYGYSDILDEDVEFIRPDKIFTICGRRVEIKSYMI